MRWSVYKIQKRKRVREAEGLGYVNAPHQPGALSRAWAKWPAECDDQQLQRGLTVVPYRRDRMSLGPKRFAQS